MPTPTIPDGKLFMNATLYTGNGTAGRVITVPNINNVGFAWVKLRSGSDDHRLANTVTGGNRHLQSNTTAAESTGTNVIQAFSGNTFTVGSDNSVNVNGSTYVGWTWANGGAAVTNTAGTISAQVSANTTSGFSVVTYTGTAANATVGHGLGVAPSMIITKNRDSSTDWWVYHASLGNTKYLVLNTTAAEATSSSAWNNTSPTSTVFSLGAANPSNANQDVAYCWAPIAGYSAFGSYTGNGSTDGPFIYTGFRPRYVMIKRTDSAASWYVYDTARNTFNTMNNWLSPNQSVAENTSTTWEIDIVSNGFKIRNNGAFSNASGGTYVYACWAENPFKFANAR